MDILKNQWRSTGGWPSMVKYKLSQEIDFVEFVKKKGNQAIH